jgi:hypothetical protein
MNKGWLINDTLTCIPGTKTFWHDLLEWIPNLEDKCNGRTPFHILANNIENDAKIFGLPDYIIRNASYFRKINLPVKTISLLQDYIPNDTTQLSVCNDSDLVVFNSPYTKALYQDKITANSIMIPLGVDFEKAQAEINQALQLKQTGVIVRSEQLKCDVCEESEWESHSEGFICGNCKNVVQAF